MKNASLLLQITFLLIMPLVILSQGNIGINDNGSVPDPSAMLDVNSTDKGILIPRMSTTERNDIVSPASGLMVFNTTLNRFNFYNGTSWEVIGAEVDNKWTMSGSHIYNNALSG
jgi:hypothetical protein